MNTNIQTYIARWHLADHLNPDLLRHLHLIQIKARQEVILQDGEDIRLYFLVAGSVHVQYDHLNGKQSTIGAMFPLALIGDLDLFYEPDLHLSIVTAEASTFLYIDRTLALRYGQDDPRFLRLIIRNLSEKLTQSTAILKHNIQPLIGQVAAYLITHTQSPADSLIIPAKSYLAELLGTTPRHLNRVLNALTEQNLIAVVENTIIIHNRQALIDLSEM